MSPVREKVCVVTGAGSGIGRALALELAQRGAAALALSDVDEAGLAETARLLAEQAPDVVIHQQHLDVADRQAFIAYADAVVAEFGTVHQVYNNAGIASGKTIQEASFEVYDKVIAVNLFGVIHGTKVFLPHLIASGDGHVINISSLNGYMAQDELSAYCTTKFGVRGFTETLRIEMLRDRLPVKATVVHPGGVKTNIATAGLRHAQELGYEVSDHERRLVQAYNDKLLRMPASEAARIIVDGVERGRPRVLVGNDARLVDLIVRALPVSYVKLVLALNRLGRRALSAPSRNSG
jgi:NAD(P)-dependent dehydrogenase (short-subunit alcohol dehydrogenase family)